MGTKLLFCVALKRYVALRTWTVAYMATGCRGTYDGQRIKIISEELHNLYFVIKTLGRSNEGLLSEWCYYLL
jgi:hypothetical protein